MKKRVAVLRGGPSNEHEVSMLTGNAVLRALRESDDHAPVDVCITKSGDWLVDGRTKSPAQLLSGIDVAFVAMHGEYGEDGQIQRLLDRFGIAYTGSDAFASARAFHKVHSKSDMISKNVKTPTHRSARRHELKDPRFVTQVETLLGQEFFAKPTASGSSVGARRITHEADTHQALEQLFNDHDELLLESFIAGTEATVAVLENFRGEDIYVMPVIEIIPTGKNKFFDWNAKYDGTTKEIVSGAFPTNIRDEMQQIAKLAHKTLGCRQYSRTDFIVREGEVFYLETNTLPGLTEESLYPKAAAAVGLEFDQLIKHLINTVRR